MSLRPTGEPLLMPAHDTSAAPDGGTKNPKEIPLKEEISRRAHQLWEENGRPSGRDEEFWFKAQEQLLGADKSVRSVGTGAVSAQQYAESTDANNAQAESRKAGKRK
jgi:Protein of unknown function (DUF2934)